MASGAGKGVSLHIPVTSAPDDSYCAFPVISPLGPSSKAISAAPEAVPLALFVVVILAVHDTPHYGVDGSTGSLLLSSSGFET